MIDRDRAYLLKEAQKTLGESDTTAEFCLCQRWILKDTIALLKEQESVIEALKSDLSETLAVLGEYAEIVRCKDCTYLNADTGICIVGIPHGYKDTFYCAYGKRR